MPVEVKRLPEAPILEKIPETGNPEASQATIPPPEIRQPTTAAANSTGEIKRGPGRPPGSTNKPKEDGAKPKNPAPKGKTGPPDFTEWQDFIGGVLIHWICVAFVSVAMRRINRDILSIDDKDDLELDEEEELLIAKPLSTWLTNSGSEFNTKYGRIIINLRESIEAMVILAFYMGRVNRVARKYKPKHAKPTQNGVNNVVAIVRDRDTGTDREINSEPPQFPPPGFRFPNAGAPGIGFN